MILMLMGEPAEMKMSEAFFSAISCRSFSMNMCALGGRTLVYAVACFRVRPRF
jgi:hypothetical protein